VLPFVGRDANGHAGAFRDAFRANEPRLLAFLTARLGSRAEAQDVCQSVFLKLWERVDELHGDNLTSLLFVTARNLATDRMRSSGWRARAESLDDEGALTAQIADDAPHAERVLAARHELKVIGAILQELPEKCRTAFIRYKFHEESYAEIAAAMALTESMIRKYVLRAMAHCAARYAQLEGWE